MVKCDVCKDELTHENDKNEEVTLRAITMGLLKEDSFHPEYKKLKKNFGKVEFTICYNCWMKSMGVKK